MNEAEKKFAAGYNRAFITLNETIDNYRNKIDGIATSSRCVGSSIGTTVNTEDVNTYYSSSDSFMTTYSWNNKFKAEDTNYLTDYNRLRQLEISEASAFYWLASRQIVSTNMPSAAPYEKEVALKVRYVSNNGINGSQIILVLCSDGHYGSSSPNMAIRCVFHLSENVKITKGEGTKENPYILGI